MVKGDCNQIHMISYISRMFQLVGLNSWGLLQIEGKRGASNEHNPFNTLIRSIQLRMKHLD